ncbi:ETC complex I subunit [Anaplasmataceae bacterium AB001_6]|nr:ETC complex I subunit [Anaplasmataceae bacterium AB001_6]
MSGNLKIYKDKNSVTQSGYNKSSRWIVSSADFNEREPESYNVNGLFFSTDTNAQMRLYFDSKEEAIKFVKSTGKEFSVVEDLGNETLQAKNYAANFVATSKSSR